MPRVYNTINKEFFNKDTEDSFYWAGFIAADGCVLRHKFCKKPTVLSINLSHKDKNHLEKLKSAMGFSGDIKTYERKNSNPCSSFRINSIEICNSLIRFNIKPKKTFCYSFPSWIRGHRLLNHFMRGYFDGDGSFYIYRNPNSKIDNLGFSVAGTRDFLLDFKQVLVEKITDLELKNNLYKCNNIWTLCCKGNRKVIKIRNFLYDNSLSRNRLERKHLIVYSDNFINIPGNLKNKPVMAQDINTGMIKYFKSIKSVKEYGFEPKLVGLCCNGRRKTHKKHIWKFIKEGYYGN